MYKVLIGNSAKRITKKFSKDLRKKIIEEANKLKVAPYTGEKLSGSLSFLYSVHFNYKGVDYRAGYAIDNKKKEITVVLVSTRENFYKKLRRIFNL